MTTGIRKWWKENVGESPPSARELAKKHPVKEGWVSEAGRNTGISVGVQVYFAKSKEAAAHRKTRIVTAWSVIALQISLFIAFGMGAPSGEFNGQALAIFLGAAPWVVRHYFLRSLAKEAVRDFLARMDVIEEAQDLDRKTHVYE